MIISLFYSNCLLTFQIKYAIIDIESQLKTSEASDSTSLASRKHFNPNLAEWRIKMNNASLTQVATNGKDSAMNEAVVVEHHVPVKNEAVIIQNPMGLGDRDEIWAAAKRFQMMIPSCAELSLAECALLAQVSLKMKLNPFVGEVYAFKSTSYKKEGGQWATVDKIQLVIGYKALIRWAKRQCGYDATYQELSKQELVEQGVAEGSIASRCTITRYDANSRIRFYVNLGMSVRDAIDQVSTAAIGVVSKEDMTKKDGSLIAPPKGWTWQQVARKRALKNAIMLAYSLPSLDELKSGSFEYDGYDEELEDPFVGQQRAITAPRTETLKERVNLIRGEIEEGIN